ncbi:MAG: Type 1 glutamine amidotransferase-like domain-containing protein [Firmicutes bacterium]|nr:peptidase E [Bacillota bacterium]MDD7102264.1 Type 1 glutamine amidotransferase-like domain-containing protein [Bacillota bacterium]
MKLYLSSYKLGNSTDELKKWLQDSDNNKMALIINSRDMFPDSERKSNGIQSDKEALEELGFKVELLDLRKYFGQKELLRRELQNIHAFYAIGGNTFVLRKAMQLSGFDELLLEYSNDSNYLYAGYSAGICCLCKDLSAISIMDDPQIDPYDSGTPPIYHGIGFIEETIIPHFMSDHKETEAASRTVEFCKQNGISYKALRDGEVLMSDTLNLHKTR